MKCKDCKYYGEICDVSKTPPDSWCKQHLSRVKNAFRLEGQELTDKTIDRCQRVISKQITIDEALNEVCDEYFKEAK